MLCNLVIYNHLPSENCALFEELYVIACTESRIKISIIWNLGLFYQIQVYFCFFMKNIFDLVQQLWTVLCNDVAFCIIVTDLDYNYNPSFQMTYNFPILAYYNNWNSCWPLCFSNLSGMHNDADSRSGVNWCRKISKTRPYCCFEETW